jgi:hypothetical protein
VLLLVLLLVVVHYLAHHPDCVYSWSVQAICFCESHHIGCLEGEEGLRPERIFFGGPCGMGLA